MILIPLQNIFVYMISKMTFNINWFNSLELILKQQKRLKKNNQISIYINYMNTLLIILKYYSKMNKKHKNQNLNVYIKLKDLQFIWVKMWISAIMQFILNRIINGYI